MIIEASKTSHISLNQVSFKLATCHGLIMLYLLWEIVLVCDTKSPIKRCHMITHHLLSSSLRFPRCHVSHLISPRVCDVTKKPYLDVSLPPFNALGQGTWNAIYLSYKRVLGRHSVSTLDRSITFSFRPTIICYSDLLLWLRHSIQRSHVSNSLNVSSSLKE